MLFTHFETEYIFQSSIWSFYWESDGMGIKITNEGPINMKNIITTLKNLIEMWQMTLNHHKFDIKKSLDTLYGKYVNQRRKNRTCKSG